MSISLPCSPPGGALVAAAGHAPAIMVCGLGFALLGLWLRYNMPRLKP